MHNQLMPGGPTGAQSTCLAEGDAASGDSHPGNRGVSERVSEWVSEECVSARGTLGQGFTIEGEEMCAGDRDPKHAYTN